MLTIQPKDDSFCTVKCKAKHNRKRHAVEWWYECSKCGHTFAYGFNLDERRVCSPGYRRSARTANVRSYIGCKEIKDRKDN